MNDVTHRLESSVTGEGGSDPLGWSLPLDLGEGVHDVERALIKRDLNQAALCLGEFDPHHPWVAAHLVLVGHEQGSLSSPPPILYRAAQSALLQRDPEHARHLFQHLATDHAVTAAPRAICAALAWLGAASFLCGAARKGHRLMRHARAYADPADEAQHALIVHLELFALLGRSGDSDAAPREFVEERMRQALVFLDLSSKEVSLARLVLYGELATRGITMRVSAPRTRRTMQVDAETGRARLPDGQLFDLGRRRAPRLIFVALCQAHWASPRRCLDVDQLVAAGWPDQKIDPIKAASRVYFVINTLRGLGLGDDLERTDRGYRLSPTLDVRRGGPGE